MKKSDTPPPPAHHPRPDGEGPVLEIPVRVSFPPPARLPSFTLPSAAISGAPIAPTDRQGAGGAGPGGMKYDDGKARYDYVPTAFIDALERYGETRAFMVRPPLDIARDPSWEWKFLRMWASWRHDGSGVDDLDFLAVMAGSIAEAAHPDAPRFQDAALRLVDDVADVLKYGARKYAAFSWHTVPDAPPRYFSALVRHMRAVGRGETRDLESGLPHLAHAACNVAFLLGFRDYLDEPLDPQADAVGE